MANGSLKLFQFIRKFDQAIGIHPYEPNQKGFSFNWRYATVSFGLAQFFLSSVGFLLFEAKFLFDYGLGIFIVLIVLDGVILHLIPIWESNNMFKYIENCEKFIEKRESK